MIVQLVIFSYAILHSVYLSYPTWSFQRNRGPRRENRYKISNESHSSQSDSSYLCLERSSTNTHASSSSSTAATQTVAVEELTQNELEHIISIKPVGSKNLNFDQDAILRILNDEIYATRSPGSEHSREDDQLLIRKQQFGNSSPTLIVSV